MKDFNLTAALSTTNEWLTPEYIIDALGPFDLDPCAPPDKRRPWDTAGEHYSEPQDGLSLPWRGRVWLNPPYGRETFKWMAKLAEHKQGIGLIFARTDTREFQSEIFPKAKAILFLKSRIAFHGIHDAALLQADNEDIRKAARKRIKGKELIPINNRFSVFKGDRANAPSVLISYSRADSIALAYALQTGKLSGKLIHLEGMVKI